MRKFCIFITLLCLCLGLAACAKTPAPTQATVDTQPTTLPPTEQTTQPTTQPTTAPTEPTQTQPLHSPFYIEGLEVEDVIQYFNEVCLDAEFVNSGDASVLQKWTCPIRFMVNGEPTEEDLQVLDHYTDWLNTIENFPGIAQTQDPGEANMQIHFCNQDELLDIMGEEFTYLDGAVTYWYDNNAIYQATICCRNDLHQGLRNSVILEEIYNGLGPIQDTDLRPDSIIYSGFSEPQSLTAVDELILRLMYNSQLLPGMNADECEAAIRQLYY